MGVGFKDVGYITTSASTVYFQSLARYNPVTINTGSNGLQRLDAVVKAAEKYGIKLIVPFVNWLDEVCSNIRCPRLLSRRFSYNYPHSICSIPR